MFLVYGTLYYIVGIAFGVMREWSSKCLNEDRLGRPMLWWSARDFLAYLNFPLIGMVHYLHGRFPRYVRNAVGEKGPLLEITKGGVLYWMAIAMIWPLCIMWSGMCLAAQIVCGILWILVIGLFLLIDQVQEWVRSPPEK